MAIVEDLTDEQFDELCRQFKPMSLPRRFEPPAPVVEATTILKITFENGFPEFSDGTSHHDIAADDAYSDDSDSEIEADDSDIAVDDLFQVSGIGARPACGLAIATLPAAVAGEATREEQCAVCMEAFMEGQELRMPCPNSHRFHESCIFRWLTVNRVCPVCRFELPPAVEETDDEDSHTDTAAGGESVTWSYEDELDGTDTEASDFAPDSSTDQTFDPDMTRIIYE
jgi:hypothetical protein